MATSSQAPRRVRGHRVEIELPSCIQSAFARYRHAQTVVARTHLQRTASALLIYVFANVYVASLPSQHVLSSIQHHIFLLTVVAIAEIIAAFKRVSKVGGSI